MIGIVLVTHGRLAEELVSTLEHIVGPQEQIATVCIQPDDDMENRRRDILDEIGRVNGADGAILLADLFGGTPSNLAISVMNETGVEVITGVNLPMIIQLVQVRKTHALMDAVAEAQEAGRKNIYVASQLLADRTK
jgi:PTS system mannose-specific IIA component